MDDSLQEQLYDRYPRIFKEHSFTEAETAMRWGIATGNGWYHLIDALCLQLQRMTDEQGAPQVVASEVKAKFGGLRFHAREADDRQAAVIDFARELSNRICEVCGAPGGIVSTRRFTGTRCAAHPVA